MTFITYKKRIEASLRHYIENMGDKGALRDACDYSLTNGGKRLRPIIVLMTADAIGSCDVMPSALSVEFFHTASLIADDLPCMDNDQDRRGVPSLHKAYGESPAILASYALIAAGYGGIYENGKIMQESLAFASSANQRAMACLEVVTRSAGIQGATQGQFLDLFPPRLDFETVRDIIMKKTVTLFEISLLFGWIFGGGDMGAIPTLQSCAYHLGMAFQIADDFEDDLQDSARESGPNMVQLLGKEKAMDFFESEIASFEKSLKSLSLWTDPFQQLFDRLASRRNLFLNV